MGEGGQEASWPGAKEAWGSLGAAAEALSFPAGTLSSACEALPFTHRGQRGEGNAGGEHTSLPPLC